MLLSDEYVIMFFLSGKHLGCIEVIVIVIVIRDPNAHMWVACLLFSCFLWLYFAMVMLQVES